MDLDTQVRRISCYIALYLPIKTPQSHALFFNGRSNACKFTSYLLGFIASVRLGFILVAKLNFRQILMGVSFIECHFVKPQFW